jgi:hypothetical protein
MTKVIVNNVKQEKLLTYWQVAVFENVGKLFLDTTTNEIVNVGFQVDNNRVICCRLASKRGIATMDYSDRCTTPIYREIKSLTITINELV